MQKPCAGAPWTTVPLGIVIALLLDPARAGPLSFHTFNNAADPTFNQLLGINNTGTIVGYFGSGAAGHPNKGYSFVPPTTYTNENFPGSVQTQVTGINNSGITVGFWSNSNNGGGLDSNFGFVDQGGTFSSVNNPATAATSPVNQLLGVNDHDVAVGFYADAAGVLHGYTYSIAADTFSANIDDPHAVLGTVAAAINNADTVTGFYLDAAGDSHGFIDSGGTFTTLDVAGATDTSLLGLNNLGEAVGFDIVGTASHGIICNDVLLSCQQIDDPLGIDATAFNGLNDAGMIVGFYTDAAGNTDGLLATPASVPEPSPLVLLGTILMGLAALPRRWRYAYRPRP